MKPIRRTFDTTGIKLLPIDAYADRGVSINVIAGAATVESTISDFNVPDVTVMPFEAVTLPGKVDYAITGFIVTVTGAPCVVEVAQHGT